MFPDDAPHDEATLPRARGGVRVPRPDENAPRSIGHYELLREIGRGGMGVVHEAHDARLGRRVALKTIPPSVTADAAALDQLEREARALAAVNHPNVASIHGIEEHEGRHYLVLEHVEGDTLARRLGEGPLSLEESLSACAQVAAGLAGAHESGVIHRDLKPGNVILSRRGVAKVLDFGIAQRRIPPRTTGSSVAMAEGLEPSGWAVGTPGYMSPEQVRGEPVDERADAWAFGCLLLACLTGRDAIEGGSAEERLRATLEDEIDLSRLDPSTPPAVAKLLRRCLERDPAVRLRDLAEARRVLEDALEALRHPARAAATPRRAGRLPARVSRFVGREHELDLLRSLLGEHRLVTLTGPGGCGKTSLALESAAHASADFAGGAWFADLVPTPRGGDPSRQVALALGLAECEGRDSTGAIAESLAEECALLILDNCEHLVAECAELASALLARCPGVRLLATSREPLGIPGERAFAVQGLALPAQGASDAGAIASSEAVRLFVDRARLVQPSFELTPANAALVREACERMDGMPLALELAAARLRHLSLEQLVERLADRFRLLSGGSRAALPRHQALRATLDWSHDLLPDQERIAFRRIGAFQGGFTLELAERVLPGDGIREADVLDLLSRLADKSLITLDGADSRPRYRTLETLREYAREKLDESGERPAVAKRLRDAVLALLAGRPSDGGDGDAAWLERAEPELGNIAAALDHCEPGARGTEDALRIAGDAWHLWILRGHWREGLARCEAALARDATPELATLRNRVLPGASALAWALGDGARAEALSLEDLAAHRSLRDERGMAMALRSLGRIAMGRSRLDEADARLTESLELSRALGDGRGMSLTLRLLALVADRRGDRARERQLTEESLVIARDLGDDMGVAISHNNLGLTCREDGDLEAARAHLESCLRHAERIGVRDLVATSLNNLGLVALDRGDAKAARDALTRGLRIRRDIGDIRFTTSSLLAIARLRLAEGDATGAARLLGATQSMHARLGTAPDLRQDWESALAGVRAALGDAAFEQAHADGTALDDRRAIAEALGEAG